MALYHQSHGCFHTILSSLSNCLIFLNSQLELGIGSLRSTACRSVISIEGSEVTGEEIDILILYLVRVDFYYGLDVVKSSAV